MTIVHRLISAITSSGDDSGGGEFAARIFLPEMLRHGLGAGTDVQLLVGSPEKGTTVPM